MWVTVSFAGTNTSAIQPDNFLSAGVGAHSPHCCVDGIDFGYRFDAYLYHDGGEMLVATAWEICDWNMACGGHSWQNLMFFEERALSAPLNSSVRLLMEWEGRTVLWQYSVGQAAIQNFTHSILQFRRILTSTSAPSATSLLRPGLLKPSIPTVS